MEQWKIDLANNTEPSGFFKQVNNKPNPMEIKNSHLKQLLDTNLIEYTYNQQIAFRMLQSVSLYIDNPKHLVQITFDRDSLLETNIWLNEDDEITLSENQIDYIYDFFETLFKERELEDAYPNEFEIDDHYYIR